MLTPSPSALWNYSQPDFYRFSEDSLSLAKFILHIWDKLSECNSDIRMLDMCAGCGVVGLEILMGNPLPKPQALHFLEAQEGFLSHLKFNINQYLNFTHQQASNVEIKVIHSTYKTFFSGAHQEVGDSYDLIVANPPYFTPEHGRSAQSSERAICRSFILESQNEFLWSLVKGLRSGGKAYFLIDKQHSKKSGFNQYIGRGNVEKQNYVIELVKEFGRSALLGLTLLDGQRS